MCNLALESSYHTPFAASPLLPLLLLSMTQKHTPDTKSTFKSSYDYIVVGGGSAGSVVASRLSEKSCVTVLLLEAGKAPPKLTDVPVSYTNYVGTDIDWKFQTDPQKNMGMGLLDRKFMISAGKVLGGSSVINGMQTVRGNRKDFDNWAAQGATGWGYDQVLPYFKKLEHYTDPLYANNGFHGRSGPIIISRPTYVSELQIAIYKAARCMGYKVGDANGPTQRGFYDFQATTAMGQRCSTAKAYLVPNDKRENLHIVTEAYVKKIIIEGKRAKGVIVDFKNKTLRVYARKEVILSAGTINSAKLLMLSGVGPAEQLSKHEIAVKADLPVGQNFQEHWGSLMNFELSDNITSFNRKITDEQSMWQYILAKQGPLTSLAGVSNMGFLKRYGLQEPGNYPDYQIYFGEGEHYEVAKHKPMMKNGIHNAIYEPYQGKPFYWCLSQLLRPKSRGQVTLRSADPYEPPSIDPRYASDPDDLDVVVAGMKKCKQFGTTNALKRLGSKPFTTIYPGCENFTGNDIEYLRCTAKSMMITCSHVVGTNKMGDPKDSSTVLDPQLRVKGIRNLRVVDASVMPNITSGNTYIPTIMIAEKASDMIKDTIRCA